MYNTVCDLYDELNNREYELIELENIIGVKDNYLIEEIKNIKEKITIEKQNLIDYIVLLSRLNIEV